MNYISKIRKKFDLKNNRPAKRMLIIGGLILCAVIIIFLAVKFWHFNHYKIETSDAKENTLVYSYYPVEDDVLKCASDSAILTNSRNETLWTITYEMAEPGVDVCNETIVIYEKNGTAINICNKSGKVSTFNSAMPIVKARVAEQGTVAVLMDDGTSSQIDYYDKDGSLISTIKTTTAKEGYPMDIALSDNGLMLAVTFIRYDQGNPVSDVCFYSFGAAGQAAQDNVVASYSYSGTIIPEVEFMGNSNCVAFGTDKLIAYDGSKTFKEKNVILLDDEVRSVFVDKNFFGIVMPGNDNSGIEIAVYNKNGTERSRITAEYSYTSITARNGMIIMNNRNSLCVYASDGVCKFNDSIDGYIRSVCLIEANRYALVLTDSYNIMRLY